MEFHLVMVITNLVFWYVMPCSLVAVIHLTMQAAGCFKTLTGIVRTKLHGGKVQET